MTCEFLLTYSHFWKRLKQAPNATSTGRGGGVKTTRHGVLYIYVCGATRGESGAFRSKLFTPCQCIPHPIIIIIIINYSGVPVEVVGGRRCIIRLPSTSNGYYYSPIVCSYYWYAFKNVYVHKCSVNIHKVRTRFRC